MAVQRSGSPLMIMVQEDSPQMAYMQPQFSLVDQAPQQFVVAPAQPQPQPQPQPQQFFLAPQPQPSMQPPMQLQMQPQPFPQPMGPQPMGPQPMGPPVAIPGPGPCPYNFHPNYSQMGIYPQGAEEAEKKTNPWYDLLGLCTKAMKE